MSEDSKASLYIPLPKASQYEASPSLTLRGDTRDQLEEIVTEFFGPEAFKVVVAKAFEGFFVPKEEPMTASQFAQAMNTPAAGVAESGPAEGASLGVGSPCPAFPVGQHPVGPKGRGTLVRRERKDGSGHFIACDAFPSCNFILKS